MSGGLWTAATMCDQLASSSFSCSKDFERKTADFPRSISDDAASTASGVSGALTEVSPLDDLQREASFDGSFDNASQLPWNYPSDVVVRNTFIDFESPWPSCEVLRRRSRSAEPLGRATRGQVQETRIAKAGVGEGQHIVPFPTMPLTVQISLPSPADQGPLAPGQIVAAVSIPVAASNELPSTGSALHQSGRCVPCGFFWTPRSCDNGSRCRFCHLCDAGEKRRRRTRRKAQKAAL
eukprot:TRINITY_DN27748_c0_g1_i1.p1 TRINITY_DN27748_c0_g1~~TRINITY_DN27748_c0_g1_i1.p1  ORF type:complete len:237 (+),score=18.75 TRINITY_DN27748_c0_g1_i1:72-782(+)